MGSKHAIIVVDLSYGDSGKGTMVDALTHRYGAHTIVRYNGGAQAAHTVVTPDGATHTFAQWGSGTFHKGVRTYLSQHMLVDPLALINEEAHLRSALIDDGYARMYIDERALLITPFARALNRLREFARNDARHGSCGMGIGETVEDAVREGEFALRMGDVRDANILKQKLVLQRERMHVVAADSIKDVTLSTLMVQEWKLLCEDNPHVLTNILSGCATVLNSAHIVSPDWVKSLFKEDGVIIFEGAQGVLIDQDVGFHPYTTWSDTTTNNAKYILADNEWRGEVKTLGVLRAYATRHGPGPFVSEDSKLTALLPDSHNVWNDWQRDFRVGWFDAVATRYAVASTNGVDALAITNLDRMAELPQWSVVTQYQIDNAVFPDIALCGGEGEERTRLLITAKPIVETIVNTGDVQKFITLIEREVGATVLVEGTGASREKKVWKGEIIAL